MARILHVVEAFGGGIVTYLSSLTHEQCQQGDDVYVAYGLRAETPDDVQQDFDSRVQWIRVRNFHRSIGLHDLKAMCEIGRIYSDVQPDIVHAHSSKAGVICRLRFLFKRNLPQFYTPHSYAFLMSDSSVGKRLFYRTIEKVLARISSSVTIACGNSEYEEAKKLGGRCTYVFNGVRLDEMEALTDNSTPDTRHPRIGIVARILPQKNPEFFNALARELPELEFTWIGDGECRDTLTEKNITITGWTSRAEALKMLARQDIFVLPSRWEGLSVSLLEAMAMKKMVIVSNIESMREIIRNGVNGFIGDTVEDFVRIIHELMNGEIDYHAVTEAAYKDIYTRYNAAVMAQKYSEIYNKV